MKVGNIVAGLEVVDVKRVNKLNLIQFLKEVDSYLQKGYRIDVNSARQVGLVLMTDMFKTEAATEVEQPQVEVTEQPKPDAVVEVVEEAPKKTTTRSKKTTQ